MVGLGRLTTRERIERISKPDTEYTGRPSVDGAVTGREGTGSGTSALESAYVVVLDEPVDGDEVARSEI